VCPLLMDSQTDNQTDGASFKVMTALSLAQVFGQVFETCGFNTLTEHVPPVGRCTATVHQRFSQACMRFIHSAVCLTTAASPLPKRVLHTMRSSAYYFNLQYLYFFLIRRPLTSPSSSSCHSIHAYSAPSITCYRRQFLRPM